MPVNKMSLCDELRNVKIDTEILCRKIHTKFEGTVSVFATAVKQLMKETRQIKKWRKQFALISSGR